MQTLLSYGFCVTQDTDFTVRITQKGKSVLCFEFSRALTGKELNELALYALVH